MIQWMISHKLFLGNPIRAAPLSLLFASWVQFTSDAFASLKDDIQSDSELVEAMRVWEGEH